LERTIVCARFFGDPNTVGQATNVSSHDRGSQVYQRRFSSVPGPLLHKRSDSSQRPGKCFCATQRIMDVFWPFERYRD
jgi:hypothetical protein